jgi:signal transduction histidine kinase
MNTAVLAELFAVLETVVLERLSEGSFRVLGNLPDWFACLCPEATTKQDGLELGEQFPFLDNFLIEAEDFWRERRAGRLKSGAWNETDSSGQEHHLEASAICLGTAKVLLIESLGAAYIETQSWLQKARENRLAHERLTKEIQKKEILLHCIVHDLSSPLMGINAAFSILDPGKLTAQQAQFVNIGQSSSQKLDRLIQEILDAFSAEIAALEAFAADPAEAPDAAACAHNIVRALSPAFALNRVTLQLAPEVDLAREWKVVGEKSRLERVISNLTENSLRHSPANSVVNVSLTDEGEQILVAIDDQGPGVPPEVASSLFQKFAQGKKKYGKAGLGLYFCRITVEHWGGEIGYAPRAEGGSRFWFRLPKPASSNSQSS